MNIAIHTGGGDAPGLNAAIRSATLAALKKGWNVFGIRNGYNSLYTDEPLIRLTEENVRGITMLGGTILGTDNRKSPFRMPEEKADGSIELKDRSNEAIEILEKHNIDALIAIGGDGSMNIAHRLSEKGVPVVGVPKTIDNDIWGNENSLGFDTAVTTATEAIDKLTTTAESHRRIMAVEVMGRYAGWIALHSGLAASADVILIPEIDFTFGSIVSALERNRERGFDYSVLVVAEGAKEKGGELFVRKKLPGQTEQLGGIARYIAEKLTELTGQESRSLVLGHLQRGGAPSSFDRFISLRFGAAAIRAVEDADFNKMIVMQKNEIIRIPLSDVAGKNRLVPVDSDTVLTARNIGICLGD